MIKFTPKEKLVFYGLVRWPDLTDDELGKKIDVKRSTVTTIRNKLTKEKLYTKHYVPHLGKLGCELLVARYGDFNPLTPWSQREQYTSREPELFYRISTDTSRVSLVAAENFTEVKKYLETAARRHASHGFLTKGGVKHVYYPLGLSKIILFFDFAPLLNKHFKLGFNEDGEIDTKFRKPNPVKLSNTEKKILYTLVQNPTLSDKDISKKLSLTYQNVHTIRNTITSKGLLKTVIFPDLSRLGFELIVFTHAEMNPEASIDKRANQAKEVKKEGSQYVIVSGNMESIMLSAFKNYTDFERTHEKLIRSYSEANLLASDPLIKFYPLHDIQNHMKLKYAPLVKKILGVGEEV